MASRFLKFLNNPHPRRAPGGPGVAAHFVVKPRGGFGLAAPLKPHLKSTDRAGLRPLRQIEEIFVVATIAPMAYNNSMEIIETSVFTAFITTLMSDDDYKDLQNSLIKCPVAGDIIKGSGGLRKLRWSASGRGKRGGSRVIYYWYKDQEIIYMLYAYAKNRQEDLTRDQLKVLSKLVEEEFK